MNTATQPIEEFTGKAAEALQDYYLSGKATDTTAKIALLEANLGKFEFDAYGGHETNEMKLRAAERVYLFNLGIAIE